MKEVKRDRKIETDRGKRNRGVKKMVKEDQ